MTMKPDNPIIDLRFEPRLEKSIIACHRTREDGTIEQDFTFYTETSTWPSLHDLTQEYRFRWLEACEAMGWQTRQNGERPWFPD